jgi:putative copper resistance protein D
VAGFVDVLLRGLALCGQAVAIGGVLFALLLLRPALPEGGAARSRLARSLALTAIGAAAVAAAQLLSLGVQLSVLADAGAGWPVAEVVRTSFFRAGALRILACAGLVIGCAALARRPDWRPWWIALAALTVLLGIGTAWTSHAAGRLGPRAGLLILDALHQIAAGVWIGGLLHLILVASSRAEAGWSVALLKRFSATAFVSVAVLIVAGVGLSLSYVDGVGALLGTSYGSMVLTKAAVLGGLVVLGAANFFAVRSLPDGSSVSIPRLRRFVEVEFGLGATVLFVAASLTSLPPASDVVADRASFAEVSVRFTPRWPALTSPKITDMPVDDRDAPRTDADRAWSEFNHHVAGLFVLGMGCLAVLNATGRAPWACHWPLLFLGLAGFLMVRIDPGAWPLGPLGFWESLQYAEVLQHRLFVLLVVALGLFEWSVRTGRLRVPWAALIFPLLCAVGGGLLLTHSHAGLNLKEEFLIEVTHVPLGVLAMILGWGRWLELRLPPQAGRFPGRIWPLAFTLVGVVLVLYRES